MQVQQEQRYECKNKSFEEIRVLESLTQTEIPLDEILPTLQQVCDV
jgi:hypothetical protein